MIPSPKQAQKESQVTYKPPTTMSGAAQGNNNLAKHGDATVSDSKDGSQPLQPQKPAAQLEEDDEFEDFPVEGTEQYDPQGMDGLR